MKKLFLITFLIPSFGTLVPVTVFTQITSASFAAKVDFATGTTFGNMAIGDLDGDGKPDIVISNRFGNSISILKNTSTIGYVTAGSFAAKVDFPAGTIPRSVAIGDVDGDGKPDIVLTNDNFVSVYQNTGTSGTITASSFAARVSFSTGLQPAGLIIGDVDGDGKPELVVANYSSNSISILRNTSVSGSVTTSSFAPKVNFTTGANPISVEMGDIDGDGKPDLVATNNIASSISVFHNISTPGSITTGSLAQKVDFTIGSRSAGGPITDLNGDGKPDIVCTNANSNNLSVFQNTSAPGILASNSFAPVVTINTGISPWSVAVGDIDGDGKPEMAVVNRLDNSISIFQNTSTTGSLTTSSFGSPVDFATGNTPGLVVMSDVDGDGNLDLIVSNSSDNTFSVFRNTFCKKPTTTIDKVDVNCTGGNDGSITVTATGGNPPYQYSKDGGGNYQTGNVFSGLTAGTYTIIVKSASDCPSASQTVLLGTIPDTHPPVPNITTLPTVTGECSVSVTPPSAMDNCAGIIIGTTGDPITYSAQATYTITWTYNDGNGNTSTQTQTVTVADTENPKANCKPATVTLVNGTASITAADINNNSTDNCGIASITISKSSFSCSDIGSNLVTLTVTDFHNNVSTCNAIVTVIGEAPTCSIVSVPTDNTYTGGISTNLYLGYGAQSTTLTVTPAANGAPYKYSWSGSAINMLSSTTSEAALFTPSVGGTYSFTVVTANKYGCTTSCSITICVTDIRVPGAANSNKIYVSSSPGNSGQQITTSINKNAVPAHLSQSGTQLGSAYQIPCSGNIAVAFSTKLSTQAITKELQISTAEAELTVIASPNPGTAYFTLKLESKDQTPVSMRVMDARGRVIDAKSKIGSNSTIQIGHNYSNGTYFLEMIQGTKRKVVQLIKIKG